MALLKLSLVALLAAGARADYDQDVKYNQQVDTCIYILRDLPKDLTTEFCIDFTGGSGNGGYGYGGGSTVTVTKAPTTTTKTLSCGEASLSTVSSTTTKTFTTIVTTYVPAVTLAPYKKRNFQSSSASFCPEYGVPCRLVQFNDVVITQACIEFLGASGAVTTTVTAGTEIVTKPATTCAPGGGYPAAPAASSSAPPSPPTYEPPTYPAPPTYEPPTSYPEDDEETGDYDEGDDYEDEDEGELVLPSGDEDEEYKEDEGYESRNA